MSRARIVVAASRWILILGIAIELLVMVGYVLGPHGVGMVLPHWGIFIWPGHMVMSAEGVLREPPNVDIDLSWAHTAEHGTVDADTGLPPVELAGPFTAQVVIWSPTFPERAAFIGRQLARSLIAIGVMWLLLRVVDSVKRGAPFTDANARRIGLIALMIGIGSTAVNAYSSWLDDWLISRSAAAPAFARDGFVSFMPVLIGLVLAVLAVAWHRAVEFQKDSEGLV